jgi:Fe-S-cluster containining protein
LNEHFTAMLEEAQSKQSELRRYFERLKRKKPRDLDQRVNVLHEQVFSGIDCLQCGNCCSSISPQFNSADISRAAGALSLTNADFARQYLRKDEEGERILREAPCPFLGQDMRCFIYAERPRACQEFPHTDRSIHGKLNLTFRNVLVCPGVFLIFDRLRKELVL